MKKSRVIIASFVGIISLIGASIGVTVAWYNSSNNLFLNTVNITFTGEKDLFIGLNEDERKENLQEELGLGGNFEPVSSMYSSSWLINHEALPKFCSSYDIVSINDESTYRKTSNAETGFFQKEVYLYSSDTLTVTLDPEKTIFTPAEEINEKTAKAMVNVNNELDYNKTLKGLNNLVKALRFSILIPDEENYRYYIIDPYKEDVTYYAGRLDVNNDGYYNSYITSEGDRYEFLFGEYDNEDKIIYDDPISDDSSYLDEDMDPSIFNAKTKKNTYRLNLEESITNGLNIAKEDSIALKDVEDNVYIPLKAYTPKKIIISLYIEGWDLDNVDANILGQFDSQISFKIHSIYPQEV